MINQYDIEFLDCPISLELEEPVRMPRGKGSLTWIGHIVLFVDGLLKSYRGEIRSINNNGSAIIGVHVKGTYVSSPLAHLWDWWVFTVNGKYYH